MVIWKGGGSVAQTWDITKMAENLLLKKILIKTYVEIYFLEGGQGPFQSHSKDLYKHPNDSMNHPE